MAYIGTEPKDVRSFGRAKFDYTATQGQTAFTGADDDGKTLGFTDGQMEVFVNGILMDESDFSTSNGNTVTLASAANLNDIISIVAMQTDIPNSDYVPASGGTFTGDVTHTGAFTSKGIDDNANDTAITIDSSKRVLIGTDSGDAFNADAMLRLQRAGDRVFMQFKTDADQNSAILFGDVDDDVECAIEYEPANKALTLSTGNNAEAMRIDSSGRVTKPSQPFVALHTLVVIFQAHKQ